MDAPSAYRSGGGAQSTGVGGAQSTGVGGIVNANVNEDGSVATALTTGAVQPWQPGLPPIMRVTQVTTYRRMKT